MNTQYRWVIVAVGALVTCVAIGAMFSLPVVPRAHVCEHRLGTRDDFDSDDARLLAIMGIAGFAWGTASDRIWRARRRSMRGCAVGCGPADREPRDLAARISARLRRAGGGSRRGALLRASLPL